MKDLPLITINIIKGIKSKERRKILIYLQKHGSTSCVKLYKKINLPKYIFHDHIEQLLQYGLIYNSYKRNSFSDEFLYYEISKIGKKIIEYFLGFLNGKRGKKNETYEKGI